MAGCPARSDHLLAQIPPPALPADRREPALRAPRADIRLLSAQLTSPRAAPASKLDALRDRPAVLRSTGTYQSQDPHRNRDRSRLVRQRCGVVARQPALGNLAGKNRDEDEVGDQPP